MTRMEFLQNKLDILDYVKLDPNTIWYWVKKLFKIESIDEYWPSGIDVTVWHRRSLANEEWKDKILLIKVDVERYNWPPLESPYFLVKNGGTLWMSGYLKNCSPWLECKEAYILKPKPLRRRANKPDHKSPGEPSLL